MPTGSGEAPWFDDVLVDPRPAWWNLPGVRGLRRMLLQPGFGRVYDLQTSSRSTCYFRLFPRGAKPEWSGIAPGCSLPDRDPNRDRLHDNDRQIGQLRQAGITEFRPPTCPGAAATSAASACRARSPSWCPAAPRTAPPSAGPPRAIQALAEALRAQGLTPVVVGSAGEAAIARHIPAALDLTGQTSFGDLADLGRAARFAVGNDTGPMHLLATAGCRAVVLFSRDSDPALCAPRGPDVRVLRRPDLASAAGGRGAGGTVRGDDTGMRNPRNPP